MIRKEEVIQIQKKWAEGIIKMGTFGDNRESLESFTSKFLDSYYNFQEKVLFKPTKASHEQFRNNKDFAMSYFIAGKNKKCQEDKGFALSKWNKITFENINIFTDGKHAFAMGNYIFQNKESKIKVEYSFVYKKIEKEIKIVLHHSSLPFSPKI
tara:strand:+ start:12949 stop:13410 length:462 start_codon:yes stop_codon:yes gene_type:complete